jgi:hypothetical protein
VGEIEKYAVSDAEKNPEKINKIIKDMRYVRINMSNL